jgi:hypothetical protein
LRPNHAAWGDLPEVRESTQLSAPEVDHSFMATYNSRLGLPLLFALTSVACLAPAPGTTDAAQGSSGPDGGAAESPANVAPVEIEEVALVGTSVTSAIFATGTFGITTIPKSASHEPTLVANLKTEVRIVSPAGMDLETEGTVCKPSAPALGAPIIGVVIDDSIDMATSDPQNRRKDVTVQFIKTLGVDTKLVMTDYGPQLFGLRDLVCEPSAKDACSLHVVPGRQPNGQRAALLAATAKIQPADGPNILYLGCMGMAQDLDERRDHRLGMLILSNGKPDDLVNIEDCKEGGLAEAPVFTVGFGPAAEGGPNADAAAVAALREISAARGGGYASAERAADLDAFFQNMGAAIDRGSCSTTTRLKNPSALQPGTKIEGEVIVGNKGARAPFTFVVPARTGGGG